MSDNNVTGIPIDLLIIGLATICAGVGGFMLGEIQKLRKESEKRGIGMARLKLLVKQICKKLDIYAPDDNDE